MLKTTSIRSVRALELSRLSCALRAPGHRFNTIQCIPFYNRPPSASAATRLFSANLPQCYPPRSTEPAPKPVLRENVCTIPNLLTVSRIIACPVLGWSILNGDYHLATGLLVYAGLTDLVRLFAVHHRVVAEGDMKQADGWIARRYNMSTVLGTILDPTADKALMTTLTVTLAMQDLLPSIPIPSPYSRAR